MTLLETCRDALGRANVQAFLRVIRACEGTADERGYKRFFGGDHFESFDAHPKRAITKQHGSQTLTSTAAGAYQFLAGTWAECQDALSLPDFSPAMQDIAAVYLIRRRGALPDVIAGRFEAAIGKVAKEWASLPGSQYGQPTRDMAYCRRVYEQHGGKYADAGVRLGPEIDTSEERIESQREFQHIPPRPDQEPYVQEKKMPIPAIVAAVLPSIIEAIPRLGGLFGSGSKVAERNVAAATAVVEIVKTATGAVNAQEAAEKVKSDPAARTVAEKAIEAHWFELVEGGGSGIDGARKADREWAAAGGFWGSPSFWVAMVLVPLVYLIVGAVVGLFGAPFGEDVRAAIANGIVGMVIGALAGYYFGQTTSRNRTQ